MLYLSICQTVNQLLLVFLENLLHMGVQALKSHAKGKKHKQLCAAVAIFLKAKPVTKSTTCSPDLIPNSSTSSSSGHHVTQKTIELTVTKSQTLSAEIR